MPTASDLSGRIRQAHERFGRAVAGLPAEVLEREPAVGTWTARDVAGNLADWANELIIAAECCLGTVARPDYFPITDNQGYNDDHAALHADESWGTVRATLDATIERAAALADSLSPEQLAAPAEAPWGSRTTLERVFLAICGHHDEHSEELERWRAGRPQD
jgi:hypothetical protein